MPFPSVVSKTQSIHSGGVTSHVVSLPATINSGDLLVAVVSGGGEGGNSREWSWPAGWTEIVDVSNISDVGLSAAYRQADGMEGSSVTVTSNDAFQSAHLVYRITGHDLPTIRAPNASGSSGVSSTPDPPSISPTYGTADHLFIVAGAMAEPVSVDGFPTSYTLEQLVQSSGPDPGNSVAMGSAARKLSTDTENPAAFNFSGSNKWVAITVAVPGLPNDITSIVNAAIQAGFTGVLSTDSAIGVQLLETYLSSGAVQAEFVADVMADSRVTTENALVSILEKNGISETATDKTNGTIVFKSVDSPSDDNSNPLILPQPGGLEYSFQKWVRLKVDGAFFAVLNLKAYTDGGNGLGTGIALWWATASQYEVPQIPDEGSNPPLFGGAPMTNAFSFISSSPLSLGEGPFGSGIDFEDTPKEIGDYLVSVLEVGPTSPSGVTPSETISFAWDEV